MSDMVHSASGSVPAASGYLDAEIQAWRKRGAYLPDFMRDFHDQKDLFKAMQEVVERSNAKHGSHRAMQATWTDYHIYTVDIFLWVLAAHGYTLQRARRRFRFADIFDFTGEAKRRRVRGWTPFEAEQSA